MKKNLLLTLVFLVSITSAFSQDKTTKYRRSNLTMVLVEDNDLGKEKQMVINSYNANPFPDKYNNHVINDKNFSTTELKLTDDEYKKAGFYLDTLKTAIDFIKAKAKIFNKIRPLNAEGTIAVLEPTKEQLTKLYIDKYIKEKKVAKQVVASWFNRSTDGKDMDYKLWKIRAAYSAAEHEKVDESKDEVIKKLIKDTDVIGNSFIVFNKMEFYENEPVARFIRDAAKTEINKSLAGSPEFMLKKALEKTDKLYDLTKEGYTVKCNTYLYQLDWNENTAQKTKDYFFNNNLIEKRAAIWDTTDIYKLKFVGKTVSGSIVVGGKKTLQEVIDLQVKRTLDNAMAKLQKENVVFRPVSPLMSVNPITAQIGLKEGVEHGQKYEILMSKDNEMGIPIWKSIGKIQVDKKIPIWDNRLGAEPTKDASGAIIETPKFTTFKGGKKAQENYFIRLLK
jgi:hypothetical protein